MSLFFFSDFKLLQIYSFYLSEIVSGKVSVYERVLAEPAAFEYKTGNTNSKEKPLVV